MTQPAWPFAPLHGGVPYVNTVDVPTAAEITQLGQQVAVAADGRVWTDVAVLRNFKWFDASSQFSAPHLDTVVYDPVSKRWVVLGVVSNFAALWTRSGAQWHVISGTGAFGPFTDSFRAASSSGGVIVAGATTTNPTAGKLLESSNGGTTWTARNVGGVDIQTMQDIAYSESLGLWFCSIGVSGTAGNGIYTSSDRVTWTLRTSGFSPRKLIVRNGASPLILGVNLQIIVPNLAACVTSSNGTTWTSQTFPENMAGGSAGGCWSDALGVFVQQGVTGVWTSPSGATGSWTKVSSSIPGGPIEAFGRLLVRGDGTVSLDGGVSWTPSVEVDPAYTSPSWFDVRATPNGVALWRGASREVFLSQQVGF